MAEDDDDGKQRDSDVNRSVPPEVVFEILKRIPARSLCRFRCVSTLWRSIISDRGFMSSHWAHWRSNPKLLATVPCGCYPRAPFRNSDSDLDMGLVALNLYDCDVAEQPTLLLRVDLQPPPASALSDISFGLLGWEYLMPRSVGGLICLGGVVAGERIRICNPSTWEYVALPDPEPGLGSGSWSGSALKWRRDDWTSLCFDPVTNKHKVLWSNGFDRYRVFAPGSDTPTPWRRIQGMAPSKCMRFDSDEVCLNGILYYAARRLDYPRGQVMVKFHVHSERFDVMGSVEVDSNWQSKLAEYSKGRVAIVDCPLLQGGGSWSLHRPPPSDYNDTVRLWVLEEAEESWSLHKLVLPPKETLPRHGELSLVGSIHAGEDLVFHWGARSGEALCLFYNVKKETFTRIAQLRTSVSSGPNYPRYFPKRHKLSLADHEDNLLALEAFKLAIH